MESKSNYLIVMSPPADKDCNQDSTSVTRSTAREEKPDQPRLSTAALNLQLPDFWQDEPRSWFAQFEALMSLHNQDDKNKYHLVISKLNKEAIQSVSDIVCNPPRNGRYEALKYRLLNVFELSDEKRIEKIIKERESCKMKLMMNNLVEQNNLLQRIEQLLIHMCETFKPDTDSYCNSGDQGGNSSGWMCWYHRRFGEESTKCADELRCCYHNY